MSPFMPRLPIELLRSRGQEEPPYVAPRKSSGPSLEVSSSGLQLQLAGNWMVSTAQILVARALEIAKSAQR